MSPSEWPSSEGHIAARMSCLIALLHHPALWSSTCWTRADTSVGSSRTGARPGGHRVHAASRYPANHGWLAITIATSMHSLRERVYRIRSCCERPGRLEDFTLRRQHFARTAPRSVRGAHWWAGLVCRNYASRLRPIGALSRLRLVVDEAAFLLVPVCIIGSTGPRGEGTRGRRDFGTPPRRFGTGLHRQARPGGERALLPVGGPPGPGSASSRSASGSPRWSASRNSQHVPVQLARQALGARLDVEEAAEQGAPAPLRTSAGRTTRTRLRQGSSPPLLAPRSAPGPTPTVLPGAPPWRCRRRGGLARRRPGPHHRRGTRSRWPRRSPPRS